VRQYPLDAGEPASILAAAIMSLAGGFARDGIGASSLGFEIFVRWTSFDNAVLAIRLDQIGQIYGGWRPLSGAILFVLAGPEHAKWCRF
jgi:hypothetical protein